MKKYNSLNSDFGYNLRSDSDSKMIVHKRTRKKISDRVLNDWKNGCHKDHNIKLSKYWKNASSERKKEQSEIMSKNLTKYKYKIFNLENLFIEECNYRRLKELKLQNVNADFCRKKTSKLKFKGYLIEKIKIKN